MCGLGQNKWLVSGMYRLKIEVKALFFLFWAAELSRKTICRSAADQKLVWNWSQHFFDHNIDNWISYWILDLCFFAVVRLFLKSGIEAINFDFARFSRFFWIFSTVRFHSFVSIQEVDKILKSDLSHLKTNTVWQSLAIEIDYYLNDRFQEFDVCELTEFSFRKEHPVKKLVHKL